MCAAATAGLSSLAGQHTPLCAAAATASHPARVIWSQAVLVLWRHVALPLLFCMCTAISVCAQPKIVGLSGGGHWRWASLHSYCCVSGQAQVRLAAAGPTWQRVVCPTADVHCRVVVCCIFSRSACTLRKSVAEELRIVLATSCRLMGAPYSSACSMQQPHTPADAHRPALTRWLLPVSHVGSAEGQAVPV